MKAPLSPPPALGRSPHATAGLLHGPMAWNKEEQMQVKLSK